MKIASEYSPSSAVLTDSSLYLYELDEAGMRALWIHLGIDRILVYLGKLKVKKAKMEVTGNENRDTPGG